MKRGSANSGNCKSEDNFFLAKKIDKAFKMKQMTEFRDKMKSNVITQKDMELLVKKFEMNFTEHNNK